MRLILVPRWRMTIFPGMDYPIARLSGLPAAFCFCFFLAIASSGVAQAKSPEEFLNTAPKQASPPPAPAKPAARKMAMDTSKLHATYLDGDFDQAIKSMETALKSRKTLTHADSVFIFKHLGVMYAATPATREKGRFYMAQLIYIEPTAKILDMYASDMIYLIFRNVQEEVETKHPLATQPEPALDTAPAAPSPQPVAATAASPSRKSRAKYWITGGAVVTAGAVGLIYVLLDDPKPKRHNIVVSE